MSLNIKKLSEIKSIKYKETELEQLIKQIKVSGSGIKSDPYIFDKSDYFPKDHEISILNSNLFIKLENCLLRSFNLNKCSNISFENCEINVLSLKKSENITINNCKLNSLSLLKSVKIEVENSEIKWLRITDSFLNSIKKSSIDNITKVHSPDTVIDAKDFVEDKQGRGNRFPVHLHDVFIGLILTLIIGSVFYNSILYDFLNIWILILLPFLALITMSLIIIGIKESISFSKRVKKHYPIKPNINPKLNLSIIGYLIVLISIFFLDISLSLLSLNDKFWGDTPLKSYFSLLSVFIFSFLNSLGINLTIKSVRISKDQAEHLINPFFPYFIPTLSFVLPYLSVVVINLFLGILSEIYLIITPINVIFTIVFLIITNITTRIYNKLNSNETFSPNTFYLIRGVSLIPIMFLNLAFFVIILTEYTALAAIIIIIITIFLLMGGFSRLIGFIPKQDVELISAKRDQRKGRYEKAIEKCQKVIQRDPQNLIAWNNLAVIYQSMEDYEKAINSVKKALEIKEDSKILLMNLGVFYFESEDYDNAIETFKKLIKIFHKPSVATTLGEVFRQSFIMPIQYELIWYYLGVCYFRKHDLDKAFEAANKAVEVKPKFKEGWVLLAFLYNEVGDHDKAIEMANKALEVTPLFGGALNQIGIAYHRKGDFKLAIETLKRAITYDPKFHLTWYSLARVYFDIKQYEKAIKACDKCLFYEQDYKEALELLDEIKKKLNNK